MSKNQVQFQAGYSLPELFNEYGTEEQCMEALTAWRWPNDFVCPRCKYNHGHQLKTRAQIQCAQCHPQPTTRRAGSFGDSARRHRPVATRCGFAGGSATRSTGLVAQRRPWNSHRCYCARRLGWPMDAARRTDRCRFRSRWRSRPGLRRGR